MKTHLPHLRTLAVLLTGLFLGHSASAQSTITWSGSSGTDLLWTNGANWDITVAPGPLDTALFGSPATVANATTVNNIVSIDQALAALTYNQTTAGQWHVTQIPAATTLTANNLTVGLSDGSSGYVTSAAMTGGGTLQVNGNLTVGNLASASPANQGTILDLSGLSNFVFNSSSSTLQLGIASGVSRNSANMNFAAVSNYVTAASVNLTTTSGSSTVAATTNLVNLGSGTNIINAGAITFGYSRVSGTLRFPGSSGGLRIRGVGGTDADRANLTVGNLNYNGGSSALAVTSTVSLFGHPVDMKLGTLTIAKNYNSSFSGPSAYEVATVSFNNGTVDVNSISIASTDTKTPDIAIGTLNIGTNGTLIVGAGGITLSRIGSGAGPATGTLNVSNATVTCGGNIQKTTGGTGSFSLIRSSLTLSSGVIGTPALPIDALTIGDSTLSLAIPLNSTNVVVNTLTPTNTTNSTINILAFPTILNYPTTYRLIKYAIGSLGAFSLGTVVAPYKGYLATNPAASSLDFVLTNGPAPTLKSVVWNGNLSGDWDTTTANWQGSLIFNPNDYALFNDSASGNTTVNLTTTLTPGTGNGLTVSNTVKSYTFGGAGSISGNVTLTKDGTNTLTLANSGVNTFSSGVNLLGGTLQLGGSDDRLPTGTTVSFANVAGTGLDLNNLNQTVGALAGGGTNGGNTTLGTSGTNTLTIGGFGGAYYGMISGAGSVTKTGFGTQTFYGANTYGGGTLINSGGTLAVANATGSGTGTGGVLLSGGTLQIGDGTTAGSVAAPIITNGGTLQFSARTDFAFTNLIAGSGTIVKNNSNTVTLPVANPDCSGPVTVNAGTLLLTDSAALGAAGQVTLNADASARLALAGNITLPQPFNIYAKTFGTGVSPSIDNMGGTNVLAGAVFLSQFGSDWIFQSSAGLLIISNLQNGGSSGSKTVWLSGSGDGALDSDLGNGGGSINTGLIKNGTGAWSLTATYGYNGPTIVSNGTLVVNGEILNSSVMVRGGTLRGIGYFAQNVTVSSGGTLAPGTAESLKWLEIGRDLTLEGTTAMRLSVSNGVIMNDQVNVLGILTQGGTLNVTLAGTVSGGEVFVLFMAGGFSGSSFSTINLPVLPAGFTWDTSKLASNGTLTVWPPRLIVSQSGNLLSFSWGIAGFKLQSQTNALSVGISSTWYDYPGGDTSPVDVTIDPANPAVFFRLVSQ